MADHGQNFLRIELRVALRRLGCVMEVSFAAAKMARNGALVAPPQAALIRSHWRTFKANWHPRDVADLDAVQVRHNLDADAHCGVALRRGKHTNPLLKSLVDVPVLK